MTAQGEMFDHVIDIVGELIQQLLDIALEARAIRSLVIVEDDNRRLGIG